MNIVITGSTGMIGSAVLQLALVHPKVDQVTIITRKATHNKHPKLVEVIHTDFLNFNAIAAQLTAQDACIYCLGVYTGQVNADKFSQITVDFTKAFAQVLRKNSPQATFCFLSGQGADSKEKSLLLFAREKGKAENALLALHFAKTFIFRPGYIYPVEPRNEPNVSYRLLRAFYRPVLSKIYPNIGVSSDQLAHVMLDVALGHTGSQVVYENKDIRRHLG